MAFWVILCHFYPQTYKQFLYLYILPSTYIKVINGWLNSDHKATNRGIYFPRTERMREVGGSWVKKEP